MPAHGDVIDEFVVRPYAAADRARLLELLRQVWPNRRPLEPHVDRRWWWQFAEPPVLLAEHTPTAALAGLCAYLPFQLHTAQRDVGAAWFVDFFVQPNQQGRGLGRRLTQAVHARVALTASLSQTEMAWRVFQKLGWRDRAAVQVSMHPWPKPWMFPRPGGHDVSCHPVDASLPVRADIDALWAEVAPGYPAIACRSSQDLIRRYASHGGRAYDLICARRGSKCVGFMVVRAPGLIVDALARPDDTAAFAAMLAEAARRLLELGAVRLHCLATPPRWRQVLARRGFLAADTPFLGARLRSQTKWLTFFSTEARVPEPGDWFVTLGDCDLELAWAGS